MACSRRYAGAQGASHEEEIIQQFVICSYYRRRSEQRNGVIRFRRKRWTPRVFRVERRSGAAGDGRRSLETSRAGVFAIGDVRSGSVKRVAAAVGEGAQVVATLHAFLATAGPHWKSLTDETMPGSCDRQGRRMVAPMVWRLSRMRWASAASRSAKRWRGVRRKITRHGRRRGGP